MISINKAHEGATRSWFCVFNNPKEHGFNGTEQEICESILELWIRDNPQRSGAVIYCVSALGLEHCHAVLEDTKVMRFTVVQKLYPGMHIEPTKGNKEQAEAYIHKRGKFEEKDEKILAKAQYGEIKGAQGQRRDLEIGLELVAQGKTPAEIFAIYPALLRYESLIKKAYFAKRDAETPIVRNVKVCWHVGGSGSGKSYMRVKLAEEYGDENVYVMTDYAVGGFDAYNGEPILFMDEFRGNMAFNVLMHVLDRYKSTFHARYSNIRGLWDTVHIASILPPERVYANMVSENKDLDVYEQLKRRIDFIIYHYIDEDGNYRQYEQPGEQYTNYEDLRELAQSDPEELIDIF